MDETQIENKRLKKAVVGDEEKPEEKPDGPEDDKGATEALALTPEDKPDRKRAVRKTTAAPSAEPQKEPVADKSAKEAMALKPEEKPARKRAVRKTKAAPSPPLATGETGATAVDAGEKDVTAQTDELPQ